MKKTVGAFGIVLATALMGLTACGSSNSTASTTAAASAGETTTGESSSAAAEASDANGKGDLKVGSDCTFAPFEYEENGEYTGFDIELMKAMADEIGYDGIEVVNTDFKGLIPGLTAEKFDVIASAMYVTDERKESIDFSDTYFPGGLCIMVQNDNTDITGPDSLNGKTVAVQVGTKSVTYLEENYPDVNIVEVEQNSEMFLQLETGKVDAVVTGRPAAMVYAKESGKVKVLDEGLTEELYAWGVRKGDTELLDELNSALETLKSNGVYDELKAKYFE